MIYPRYVAIVWNVGRCTYYILYWEESIFIEVIISLQVIPALERKGKCPSEFITPSSVQLIFFLIFIYNKLII